MRALDGWRIGVERDGPEIEIVEPEGAVVARVVPAGRRGRALWRAVGLDGRLQGLHEERWRTMIPSIPRQAWAVVTLADGTRAMLRNGAPRGPLRRAEDVRVTLEGRRYVFAHTSGSTAEVRRDGRCIAQAWSGGRGRPDGARPAAFSPLVDLALGPALDRIDQLAVVLLTGTCGPAGRIGALRRIAHGAWDDFLAR